MSYPLTSISIESILKKTIVPYTLRPYALPVPAVAHVYAESSLVYKLVVMKNRIAISDKLILTLSEPGGGHICPPLLIFYSCDLIIYASILKLRDFF